ncbi:DUF11 domain-containing protein [Myroides sp. NP-2]|uniref:DUF11 domain-containing protein n=1 Tax=Myroides sp. NP-2 TaxID=2759945 RepID=UPI0015F8B3D5|nr:DUF11 domain-containing protein [Myroides sp. NP-2]MBB1149045.1 DUF11 domain-containing protein [Myroides sp. NP-2]
MKEKTTFSLWMRVLLFLVLLVPLVHGYGQTKVFAAYESHATGLKGGLLGDPVVDQPEAVNQRDNEYATLYASPGVAVELGGYKSYLQLQFPVTLEAGTWSYIQLEGDSNLFSALLGGSLGEGLGRVLGAILLGKQEIKIEALNSDNDVVLTRTNNQGFNIDNVRLIQDQQGNYLLAIKPDVAYSKIKISNKALSLVGLFAEYELKVYEAFTYTENASICGKPLGTSFDGKGINLSVLPIGDGKLSQAIDDSLESYSTLKSASLLDVNIGGYLSQYFYFSNKTTPETTVNIKLSTTKGTNVANLDLLGSVEVIAWNENNVVYRMPLSGGIIREINVLGLLGRGEPVTVTIAPTKVFDKLEIRLNSPIGLTLLGSSLNIYDVESYDGTTCINQKIETPLSTEVPFETASCAVSILDTENSNFALNAVDNNNETYATLHASTGSLLSSLSTEGMIHMAYNEVVPAYTTSYIRIDAERELLDNLLGGTLGSLLSDVVGTLLGNHYFEVEAYEGTNSVLHATSKNRISTNRGGKMTLVQDSLGRYYIAVTPNQPYQSIKITNKVLSIPNGEIRTLKVYNMCREMGTDACFLPQFTSFDQDGLSLGLGDLGKPGVKNPYYAISGNSSQYAEINNGLVAVGGHLSQAIYFGKPSQLGDQVKMRVQLSNPSALSLDVLGRCKVVTYLGDEVKESFTLEQGLITNLNVLNLFKSGGIQTLVFDTTQRFDRVELQVGSLLNVDTAATIRLYDVKRVSASCPESSTPSPFVAPVCATTLVDASNANDLSNLFDDDFDSFTTLQSGAGLLLGLGNKFEGFVELGYTDSIPAYTTSYVRIDFEETALEKLVGGSLGNLVTVVLDGLVFGKHDFEVQVKDKQGNVILNRNTYTTNASSSEGTIKVVVDKEGRTYLAITPTSAYQSVRIIDKTNSALGLLSQPNSMNVYGMCYETAMDPCVAAFATSYEYEGVNLSVNALGGAGVTNPERAIDDNTTHASELSLGTLNVAGQVKQWFYFNSLSEIGDVTNIRLKAGTAGLVTLPILEKLEIAAYKGDTFVDRLDWDNGLLQGTEVLELLNSSSIIDLPFKPNGQYDRISIGLKSLVSVDVLSSLDIYKVERLCKPLGSDQKLVSWKSYKVNDDATVTSVSGGEQVEYTIHVKNVGDTPISQFNIADKLPAGTTFSSAIGGRLSDDGKEVLFDFSGTMNPGSERQFVFHVMVQSDLAGILEIKNIAFTKESGSDLSYPSYPPVDNTNPTEADMTKSPGTIIHVSHVASLPKAIITSNKAQDLCAEETFVLDSNISNTEADTYQWYFNGEAIDATIAGSTNPNYGKEKTLETNHAGSYTVVYTKGAEVAESSDPFVVTQLPSAVIQFSDSQRINVTIPQGQSTVTVTLPTASVPGANGTETITWYNNHAAIFDGTSITFDTPGVYVLTVVATALNQCETFENVIVTVYDSSLCPPTIERVYATDSSSWGSIITGGVSGTSNTIDGDPTTHSTLTTGIGLLGIGTVWQNIYFEEEVAAGTPVTIKLGKQYSGLMLAGGISVVGLDANGNTIGTLKSVQGGLLDLLAADNVVEFTFVPSNSSGPKKYKGVRVSQGSLLSVAQIAKVYHAYYTENVSAFSPKYCEPVSDHVHPAVLDVLHGVQDLGLGVASATASVVNPWNAVDGNLETHATISRGVAVLNAASLTVIFKQQAMPGDKLHIVTEVPGNPILSLELIKGYTIQRYLGDQKVGEEIDGTNGAQILDLKLLGLGYRNKYKMIIDKINQPFDRVKISYGSVVGVLGDFTRIYEVTVAPKVDVGIDIEEKYLDMCQGGVLTINVEDGCSTYEVYAEETGGTPLPTDGSNNFRLPYYLPEYQDELPEDAGLGPKYSVVYVQTYRNGCVIGRRLPIRLNMRNCSVKSNLNVTQKIK